MENIIRYYYNFNVDKFSVVNNVLLIESNNKLFVAKEIKNKEEFDKVLTLLNNEYYQPIINKDGSQFFEYQGKFYCFFHASFPNKARYSEFSINPVLSSAEIDYTTIWSNNIEYFIKQLTNSEPRSTNSINNLNYYIGMSENAITINEKAKKMPGVARLCISHYRIKYPNYNLNYCDPTELLIDYISRDIAEYTKSKFFSEGMTVEELLKLINDYNLNDKELMYLFARLLYPNYYFDVLNNIEKQQTIIEKRENYEKFLSAIFNQTKTMNMHINITWLN